MGAKRFRFSVQNVVFAVGLLLVGVILLASGWWLRPIADAQQAARDGRFQQALQIDRLAEARFASMPLARGLMPRLYDLVITNELASMYALRQYDEVIDKAGATATPGASFWAGCALFAKGDLAFLTPDKRIKLLVEAEQEFRRAVEYAPADFGAKFNYEVTAHVIAGVEREPNAPRPKDLSVLTPSNAQTPKKAG